MKLNSIRLVAILLVTLCAPAAFAQFDSGTILGSVKDPQGSFVPSAPVVLKNLDTGVSVQTNTDASGNYQFVTVHVGRYEVSVAATGFQPAKASEVELKVNARQRVDFTLRVLNVQTSVDVSATASAVEADSSDRGQVINQQQVLELPLDGRNYSDLALLSVGVRQSSLSEGSQPREGSFNVNGLRSSVNNFMLDGVDNNSYATSNQGFSNQVIQPSPDAIVEFKVQTNNMSAEFGRSLGATVNVAFKSGTNSFHGSAWEFVRNTSLNAVGFFKPVEDVKPVMNRNQFGFTAGGPIQQNRTFFFVDYEGFRLIRNELQFATLPTMDQRAGKLGSTVIDPYSGAVYSGGTIPANVITPFARKVLDDLPAPNRPGTSSNYSRLVPFKDFSDKGDVKIDRYWNDRVSSFVRISQRKDNRLEPGTIPGASGGNGNGRIYTLNQGLVGATTFILNPVTVLEVRFGATRTRGGKMPPMGGGPDLLATYGISGYTSDERVRGGLNTQSVSGYTAFGRQSTNPQWQYPTVVNPRVNVTRIAGHHTFKAGYEYQMVNVEDQDANPLYGQDTYSGVFSRPAKATGTAIYNLADFMLGARSQIAVANLLVAQLRQRMQFAYLQDDWKVSSRLTLNLGVRYEYATPQYEANNKLSNYDYGQRKIVLAHSGSISDRALVNPDRNNFAPRIGLAYSVDPKTVIRSGYGINYNHFTRGGAANLLAFAGPQLVNVRIEQQPGDKGFLKTMDGLPAGITDPDKFDPKTADVKWIPQDTRTSYLQNWFFSVQREVVKRLLLDVAYVGNHGLKQAIYYDLNQARPNLKGENLTIQQRRPDQNFSAIRVTGPSGWSRYNALQVRTEYRGHKGLYLLNSFSWSKGMDNGSDALEVANGDNIFPQDGHDFASNKALSSYDQPFTNVTSVVYELPVGRGQRFASGAPAVVDAVIGGWRLGVINNMWSGQPVNLSWTVPTQFQVSSQTTMRPNVLGPVMLPADQRTSDQSFIVSNVVVPTDPSQPFGNAGRNIARGFPYYGANVSLQKYFRLPWEGVRLQFRGEAFNALNHTNFAAPEGSRSSLAFGSCRSARAARQIQLALKLYW
jgi:hypothetical protein